MICDIYHNIYCIITRIAYMYIFIYIYIIYIYINNNMQPQCKTRKHSFASVFKTLILEIATQCNKIVEIAAD